MARSPSRRVFDHLTIAAFACALLAPSIDLLVRDAETRSPETREMRAPAPFPRFAWNTQASSEFPPGFDAWFGDRFGLRDQLIRWRSLHMLHGFGVSPRDDVVLGKDGWMFYTGSGALDCSLGVRPLSADEVETWRAGLQAQSDAIAALGGRFLWVVAPNKESVYPEYLPDSRPAVGPSRLDQVFAALRANSTVEFVDLRPALVAEKSSDTPDDALYFWAGSHWYGRGAYCAYAAIVERMSRTFPALTPIPRPAPGPTLPAADSWPDAEYVGDLLTRPAFTYPVAQRRAQLSGRRQWGPGHSLRGEIADQSLPRVLLYEDSMGAPVEELLAENCELLVTRWTYELDLADVYDLRPDFVIALHVERVLQQPGPRTVSGDRKAAPAYDGAIRTLVRLDPEHDAARLRALGAAVLTPVRDETGPGIAVDTSALDDCVLLPPFEPPADGPLYVEIVLDAPLPSYATLWHKPRGATAFTPAGRLVRPVHGGANRLLFALDAQRSDGELKLRTGWHPGRYVLRSFEVRAP